MSIFKKLKDVLFDVDEDDELPIITEKETLKKSPKYKEENTIKEIKIAEEEIKDKTIESTFNFPIDFEEEPQTRQKRKEYGEISKDYVSIFEEEVIKEPLKKPKQSFGTIYEPEPRPSRTFKTSPIISPVYGILDQNYSKDDIIVKTDIGVKGPNLDEVRKKAYGLEDKKVTPSEFDDSLKTLDEILMEKDTGEISLPKKKEESKSLEDTKQEGNITTEDIEKLTQPPQKEKNIEEDTLESDLFNLIDSMYEDREEREEK